MAAIAGDAAAAGMPPTMSTFRGRLRLVDAGAAAAVASVAGCDGCYHCCRKTSGPGRYSGGRSVRSKVHSCSCKLVALAGDDAVVGDAAVAVGSAGVMIVAAVCLVLFGRSVGPRSHCFAFEDLDLSFEN